MTLSFSSGAFLAYNAGGRGITIMPLRRICIYTYITKVYTATEGERDRRRLARASSSQFRKPYLNLECEPGKIPSISCKPSCGCHSVITSKSKSALLCQDAIHIVFLILAIKCSYKLTIRNSSRFLMNPRGKKDRGGTWQGPHPSSYLILFSEGANPAALFAFVRGSR